MGCCPGEDRLASARLGVPLLALGHQEPELLGLPLEQLVLLRLALEPPVRQELLLQAWPPDAGLGLQLLAWRQLALEQPALGDLGSVQRRSLRRQALLRRRWNLGMHRAACALLEAQRLRTPSERTRPCPAVWSMLLSK